ncbi:hypothetical protein U0070_021157 [Myodes glareolus]|uniref:WH1 domain-containing protein n=1 Tax=Myodes glareolus TaxID=447135 RepID=A0AAW0IKY0_MYOGA
MTFTKTSQKFGQWADSRANTVFGLGFSSEQQLTKVSAFQHETQWARRPLSQTADCLKPAEDRKFIASKCRSLGSLRSSTGLVTLWASIGPLISWG